MLLQRCSSSAVHSPTEGLEHGSVIFCDNLVGIAKAALTDYVGALRPAAMTTLDRALRVALDL